MTTPERFATVAAAVPGLHVLHAASPEHVCRALDKYPRLHGYPVGLDDRKRVTDLAATAARARMQQEASNPEDYLRSLDITLTFAVNNRAHLTRMAELSRKTNQLNTAFSRFTEAQIERRLDDADCRTVTVALRDRLSDSGLIAAIFLRTVGTVWMVDELVISCRALGRNLEYTIVTEAIRRAWDGAAPASVRFAFQSGPRNQPAQKFIQEYTGCEARSRGALVSWDSVGAAARAGVLPGDMP